MANLNRQELIEQIDWERRENNAKFVSPTQTSKLLDRALKRVLREPGIRTIEAAQTITASASTSRYALDSGFKEVISLFSGEGVSTGIKFDYRPVDEYHALENAYVYAFLEPGYIDIKFPDLSNLPDTSLILRYWTKNIILDVDGVTAKRVWGDDGDTSRLGEEFDDFYISWPVAKILQREGKKEWRERLAEAESIIAMLKDQPGSKTRRPRRSFGFLS